MPAVEELEYWVTGQLVQTTWAAAVVVRPAGQV
jgi:hypothetical protein